MFGKKKIATLVAEFLGTGVLTFAILSVQRSNIGVPFFVATGAGIALAVVTYALHETSGAHFNPAITLALWTARKVSTLTSVLYIIMQFLGAWAAYGLYIYMVNSHIQPIGGHYTARILVGEAVGTAVFSFGVAATVFRKYRIESVAAFTGIAYMIGVIIASPASVGLLNPAVALGVRSWVWGTYVLGPILGALLGINLYNLVFASKDAEEVKVTASASSSATVVKPAKATAAKKKPAAKKKTTKK